MSKMVVEFLIVSLNQITALPVSGRSPALQLRTSRRSLLLPVNKCGRKY